MNRRQVFGLSASMIVSAGCLERTGRANDSTPPSSQTDTATKTTESPTRIPDCRVFDLSLHNDTPNTISVSLRIIQAQAETAADDPGTATPTSTPKEVFSDSFQLRSNDWQKYEELPDEKGPNRLEVEVEGGRTETEEVQAREWEQTSVILVDIKSESIQFMVADQARPKGCGSTPNT